MKGLRIIPVLLVLLFLVYLGVLFVEANQETVILSLGTYQTQPTRLGFIVLTSVLVGILMGASLASAQIILLFFHNRRLRKKVAQAASSIDEPTPPAPTVPSNPGSETYLP